MTFMTLLLSFNRNYNPGYEHYAPTELLRSLTS